MTEPEPDTSFHIFREERPGRWILEFPRPVFDLSAFDAFLDDFQHLLEEDNKNEPDLRLELVVDLTNLRVPPDFAYVERIMGFMGATDEIRAKRCGTTVIVAPSPALRALVSTVCTLQPPCTPVEVVSERPREGDP